MHQEKALSAGEECRVVFYSPHGPITLNCEVARTGPNQALGTISGDGAWRTGLKIVSMDAESGARLRRLMMTLTEH